MDYPSFKATLNNAEAPDALPPLLRALWYEAKGDWGRAHDIAQDVHDADGAWVHAYLHRREGDNANARYWYRRAGRPFPGQTLDEEWETIARELAKG